MDDNVVDPIYLCIISVAGKVRYCKHIRATFTPNFGTVLYGTVPRRYG